jgi:hypothetical protein
MGWGFQSQLVLSVSSQGWILRVGMDMVPEQVGWVVLAAAAPRSAPGLLTPETVKAGLDAVLAEHQHRNLGVFRTLSEAVAVAERYADAWQRRPKGGELCACEEIEDRAAEDAIKLVKSGALNGEHVDGTNDARVHD